MSNWQEITTATPAPEKIPLMTKISDHGGDRNEQILIRRGKLWWTPEPNSMYVYYSPTHFKTPTK